MPFILTKSRFNPAVEIPDRDSVRFQGSNPALWITPDGTPVRLCTSDQSKNIIRASYLESIKAVMTTTSKMNWFLTPFLSPYSHFRKAPMHRLTSTILCSAWLGCIALLSGCNSLPQNIALGAGLATVTGAMIPGHDIEQIYYLGAFDPQEQIPPSLFRVRVRGQASIISWMRFGSGWVPANIIDSLGSNAEYAKALGISSAEQLNTGKSSNLTLDRRLIQFGPEGFREVPRNHRLVLVMGASPEKFFDAMDRALGDLSSASVTEADSTLHRNLFEALTLTKSERELLDSALQNLQQDWAQPEGK